MRNLTFIAIALCWGCSSGVETVISPAQPNSSLPFLTKGADGNLYLSWITEDNDTVSMWYSQLNKDGWDKPTMIASGVNWFVNWADYPMMAVGKSGSMLAHFPAKSSTATYSYDVNVTFREPSGTWSDPITPHSDGTLSEHGFVTSLPRDDKFILAWLDGRNTGGNDRSGHGEGAMTFRTATINGSGSISYEFELDNRVCDCCQTDGAMTASGPVFVYRDRSFNEIRDISIVRWSGGKWIPPNTVHKDNWEINGCPVNGPRIDAINNAVAVSWFTANNGVPKVNVAFSEDGGANFNQPIIVDDSSPIGRVDLVMTNERTAIVSWLAREGQKTFIKARLIRINQSLEEPIIITETSGSRQSGFPQMELFGNELFFAWTQLTENDGSQVRVSKLSL